MSSFTHIINPYLSQNEKDNAIQQVTFSSIEKAIEYGGRELDVEVVATIFSEDKQVVPSNYKVIELERSTQDIKGLMNEKKLPFLSDIIKIAAENSQSEYLVYTNIDIGLMPQFYVAINDFINQGYESFVINRRRVSEKYHDPNQLTMIYSEVGKMHNGFDCFVFPRKLVEKFELGAICVGVPHIGNSLAFNLMCFSKTFRLFTDKHLTFHIGFDLVKKWGTVKLRESNKREYLIIIKELSKYLHLTNVPGASFPFLKRHFVWLMNPNFHYPTMLKLDLKEWKNERYTKSPKKQKGFYEWLQKKVKLDN